MKNLRSLFVIPRYWPAVGGAELHTRELAHRLSQHHKVGVIRHCSDEAEQLEMAAAMSQSQIITDNNIDVHQIAAQPLLKSPLQKLASHIPEHRSARKIYNVLYKQSIQAQMDHVAENYNLIHSIYNGLTASTEAALATARKQAKPFVWTPLAHTEEPDGTAWSSKAFRRLYQQTDALITMTSYEKDYLVEMGAHSEKVHVCPVSALLEDKADPGSFRKQMKLDNHPVVLFLGRHVNDKGYRQLVEAADSIWKSHPQTRFLFVGPGDKESEEYFSHKNDSRIIRIPQISDIDKCSALAACDLLCVPSIKESLGVIYLEAWYYAKPVVAADIPVLHTVIENKKDGLLCQQNASSIAKEVNYLLSNPDISKQIGKTGQDKFNTLYKWDHIANTMKDIYADLISSYAFKKAQ